MKSILAEIVIQNMEFFGLAPDSEIDPDSAVRQLEFTASLLKELSETELNDFLRQVTKRLEDLRRTGAPQKQLDFLENIREAAGI
jgi:hypothetical protein